MTGHRTALLCSTPSVLVATCLVLACSGAAAQAQAAAGPGSSKATPGPAAGDEIRMSFYGTERVFRSVLDVNGEAISASTVSRVAPPDLGEAPVPGGGNVHGAQTLPHEELVIRAMATNRPAAFFLRLAYVDSPDSPLQADGVSPPSLLYVPSGAGRPSWRSVPDGEVSVSFSRFVMRGGSGVAQGKFSARVCREDETGVMDLEKCGPIEGTFSVTLAREG